MNGQKFEVKYKLSEQNENRSYDQYMGYNNGHALYVVYTPNTTNIHFFYSNDEFFQHSDIIISEYEANQIADIYISQYIDINEYTLFIKDINNLKQFCYVKTINGIETEDYCYVEINKYGIISCFHYNYEKNNLYDNINIGDIDTEWVYDKVNIKLNEIYESSDYYIDNVNVNRNILSISDDGRRYITAETEYKCYNNDTSEIYSSPAIYFIILLD